MVNERMSIARRRRERPSVRGLSKSPATALFAWTFDADATGYSGLEWSICCARRRRYIFGDRMRMLQQLRDVLVRVERTPSVKQAVFGSSGCQQLRGIPGASKYITV